MAAESIRLGVMPPLSGLVDIYGPEISMAARIACMEVNESGGVLGRPLELIIEDDGSLPKSSVAAAKKLVDHHRCAAIIGNLLSNSRISVAYQVAEPRRIPYLNFSFYEGSIYSRYFFHFAALPNQQIDKMIPCMKKMYGPAMYFAGNNYEWPRGSIDAAKLILEKSEGTVAGEEYYPIGIPREDIETLLGNVEKSGADVFVPYFAGIDQVHLLEGFTAGGLKKKMAVVMGHFDEVMASHLTPEVREGFYSSNTYFMTIDTPENSRYLDRLKTMSGITGIWPKGNGLLTNFGEGTYLCVKAFAIAANKAGSVEPEAVIRALETLTLAGPQGSVSMDPATHHARVNTYLSCCQADGSFKIVENFGAVDPVLPRRYRHLRMGGRHFLEEDMRIQSRMLEYMNEAVFLVDAGEGTILYTNPGSEMMFGYGSGELLGKNAAILNAPSDRTPEETAGQINRILYRKGVWSGEIRNIKKDGSIFWCSASISAFTHPEYGEVLMSVYMDITDRKNIEDALSISEEKYRSLIHKIQAAVVVHGPDTRILTSNKVAQEILGLPEDQMIGKTAIDLAWHFFREDNSMMPLAEYPVNLVISSKEPLRDYVIGVYRPLTKDNVWVLVNATPIFDEEGNIREVVVTFLDITERKRAEEEIRLSEAKFRLLFESMMAGVVIQDAAGKIIQANPAACAILGLSMDQMMGRTAYDERWRLIKEDGTPYNPGEMPSEMALRTGQGVSSFLTGIFVPEKVEYRWILINSVPMKGEMGRPIATITTFLDVTDRRRAEETLKKSEVRLSLALEAGKSACWEWNFKTGETVYSSFYYRMLGYEPDEFPANYDEWKRRVHPDDIAEAEAFIRKYVIEEKTDYSNLEARMLTKDGGWRWISGSGKIVERDAEGYPVRLIGVNIDIDDRKQAEIELHRYRKQLEEIVKDRTAELEKKITEIERINKLFVGRELRMIELKERIRELEKKSG